MAMRRFGLIVLFLLSLPILLFVYQPKWKLEAFGMLLGMIGYTVSPVILFTVLILYIKKAWGKK